MSVGTQGRIRGALAGPSDFSFVSWLLDETEGVCAALECALLEPSKDERAPCATEFLEQKELALVIYEKLAASLADTASQQLVRGLQERYILVGATLFDLAQAYNQTHPRRLRALLELLCANAPWLMPEMEAASDMFIHLLAAFQSKHMPRSGETTLAFATLGADIELQCSMAQSWLSLIAFCQLPTLVLLCDDRCMRVLSKAYDAATGLALDPGRVDKAMSPSEVEKCRSLVQQLKWLWTSLAYCIIRFLLDIESKPANPYLDSVTESGCAVLLNILEDMYTAETNLTPFANAPFLLDLEFRFNLRQMLANASLKSEVLDRAQLDYIIMSIDQLVDMADPLYQDGLHSLTARIDHARQCLEQTPVGANGDAVLGAAETHSNDVVEDSSRDTEAIRQIKELIPDLGDGFIRACLDYYGSNTEAVVGALFEGNLPPSLAEMDRTASSWIDTSSSALNELHGGAGGLEDDADKPAQPDVLGSRRNIFDNDEFDIFRRDNLDWSRVQQGKTKAQPTRLNAPSGDMKTRIMEIAQRIEEDDEYDDTYDTTAQDSVVDDVYFDEAAASARAAQQKMGQPQPGRSSGAPTQSAANPTETQQNTLIRHYIEDSSIFERKRVVRNSPARTALCAQTGLTHEQIEGWYIMFRKNPRHQQIADRHATSKRPSAIEAPAAEADSDQRRNQAPTPVSAKPDFKRKEKNKAKSANHDRKRQHALKVRNTLPGPFQ